MLLPLILMACTPKTGDNDRIPTDELAIEYIAHASFLLSYGQTSILLDPFADRVWLGYDFPKGIEADAVFITHPHYDHDGGIFRGLRPYWMLQTPFFQNPRDYTIGDFQITGLIGKHCDPYGKEFGQMNTIWKITVNDMNIAHWGDNAFPSAANMEALQDVDVLLIPMDGDYHILSQAEYDSIFSLLAPKIIIPMHYRIPSLETDAGNPSDLGEVDPFLDKRPFIVVAKDSSYIPQVERINSHRITVKKETLPKQSTYIVLRHSPIITPPDGN